VRFFVDACISKHIVKALRELTDRESITYHEELFSADTPDAEWISELRQKGDWIIVSADDRIRYSAAGKAARREARLTAFFFEDFARRNFWIQARDVIHWWPTICQAARESPVGTGFAIRPKAKDLKKIYDPR
jgi:hypothetical protein